MRTIGRQGWLAAAGGGMVLEQRPHGACMPIDCGGYQRRAPLAIAPVEIRIIAVVGAGLKHLDAPIARSVEEHRARHLPPSLL